MLIFFVYDYLHLSLRLKDYLLLSKLKHCFTVSEYVRENKDETCSCPWGIMAQSVNMLLLTTHPWETTFYLWKQLTEEAIQSSFSHLEVEGWPPVLLQVGLNSLQRKRCDFELHSSDCSLVSSNSLPLWFMIMCGSMGLEWGCSYRLLWPSIAGWVERASPEEVTCRIHY